MKIRIYVSDEDTEKRIWIPTGFLFSRVGMYFLAKLTSAQARKEYEQKLNELSRSGWDADPDDLLTVEDVQRAERLTPPITADQARELLAALRDARYLMGGLPLASIDTGEGLKVRVDL